MRDFLQHIVNNITQKITKISNKLKNIKFDFNPSGKATDFASSDNADHFDPSITQPKIALKHNEFFNNVESTFKVFEDYSEHLKFKIDNGDYNFGSDGWDHLDPTLDPSTLNADDEYNHSDIVNADS